MKYFSCQEVAEPDLWLFLFGRRSLPTSPRKCTLSKLLRITPLPEPLRTHMVALLLASSNVVGMLVSPSAPMARDAGHAARRTTQLQMVRPSSDEPATLPVA